MDLLPWGSYGPRWSLVNSHIMQQDPAEHSRLRQLVTTAFTACSLQNMRTDIMRIADELLDGVAVAAAAGNAIDLVQSYAVPLPLRVISNLLGVPSGEAENYRVHIEPLLTTTDVAALGATEDALAVLLDGLIAHKRTHPADDLLSALVHASDGEARLAHDELVSMTLLLILAGYDTATHLISNCLLTLLRNISQLTALRADPSLLPGAVEELLRFESPLNIASTRLTTETVRVGDVEIPPGQLVFVSMLLANDDARRCGFRARDAVRESSFPHRSGIHHCLGARLARLEGEIAIGCLIKRFGRITLADKALLRRDDSDLIPRLTTLRALVGP